MFLALFFLSVLGALSAIPPLNITEFVPYSNPAPENSSLRLQPFPNPFPIPDTDITIQWAQVPNRDLPEADVKGACLECDNRATAHVRLTGDGPIPGHFEVTYGSVVIIFIQAYQGAGLVLYSEISIILMAISQLLSRQGYRQTWVGLMHTHGGGFLGSVSVADYDEEILPAVIKDEQ